MSSTPKLALLFIAGGIGLALGSKPLKQHQERALMEAVTADWGLAPAQRDRVWTVLNRELLTPLITDPAYTKVVAELGIDKTQAMQAARELGRRAGPRLSDADLAIAHRLAGPV